MSITAIERQEKIGSELTGDFGVDNLTDIAMYRDGATYPAAYYPHNYKDMWLSTTADSLPKIRTGVENFMQRFCRVSAKKAIPVERRSLRQLMSSWKSDDDDPVGVVLTGTARPWEAEHSWAKASELIKNQPVDITLDPKAETVEIVRAERARRDKCREDYVKGRREAPGGVGVA